MFLVDIPSREVKDYLDWVKILLSICSAAIFALLFKYHDIDPLAVEIKISAALFVLSLFCFLLSYVGLVEHKARSRRVPRNALILVLGSGWLSFALSFLFLLGPLLL
ncbi:hypothetical protein [Guyparkeria sp. TX1]|uniref:hypothetical protein n=1 Tax=Guyparkeria sp. TX1 TaxID=3115001 RepID=UPI003977BA77